MYKAKAYSAASATSPLTSTTIKRREPMEHDVQIEILFCGICHSDLHQVRNEWSGVMPTVYPAYQATKSSVASPRLEQKSPSLSQATSPQLAAWWTRTARAPNARRDSSSSAPISPSLTIPRQASGRHDLWRLFREHSRGPEVSSSACPRT